MGVALVVQRETVRDFDGHCRHRRLLLLSSTIVVNRKCPSRRTFFPKKQKKSYETQMSSTLIPQYERKKMSAVFRNSCLSQSRAIVDAKVSSRHRRCCAPCRNIIGCKSSFTCHVLLGFCLLSCWVEFKVRSLSF